MKEEVFIVLQNYLFEYLVDKTLIETPSRIMFDGDTVTHFNLNEEGDCIVISSVWMKSTFLQSVQEPNYLIGGQEKYSDEIQEKIFVKYYGKYAGDKLFNIVHQKRMAGSPANEFLKNNNFCLNWASNIKTIQQKINTNMLEIGICEAIIKYQVSSFASKISTAIIDADLNIG